MNKTRIAIISALVPVGLVLIAGIWFVIDRATHTGEILGSVSVQGVELGGLGREDAAARLADLEATLASTPIEVTAAGHTFSLVPADVGYDLDMEAVLEEAFTEGRNGNLFSQIGWWFGHFGGGGRVLDVSATYDPAAVAAATAEWELEGIADPPHEGNVEMVDGEVTYEYPRAGTGIDHAAAAGILGEAILDPARPAVELPTTSLTPVLTAADIDAVVAEANSRLADPVTLLNQELSQRIEIPVAVLARSLTISRDDTTDVPTFDLAWANGPLSDYVEPLAVTHATQAVDAQILINEDDTVTLVPSIPPQTPDLEPLAAEVEAALASVTRTGPLAFVATGEAEFSTADAEALGIREKISEFTTYHSCCENRVTNIHLIAAATDGALVMPGETFSLNDHVGERTAAKGYVSAGAIINGYIQCCDSAINIGGGTSQFSTTMYNAIFYAGLEDVYHFPHTIWFTRYPEGIEATMGYPEPDLKFRNNTESAVLIKTSFTDTSVTVKMFGDNGGIEVEAEKSDRFNYTGPITIYEVNNELDPCEYGSRATGRVKEAGGGGWSIRVFRHITYPDAEVTTEEWVVHYDGPFRVIEYSTKKCKKPKP
ncbi:MAG: VanW family protein [Actinobacteria bacterium]|nr:VanW family protein [Actinomycetota bacterium]